MFFVSCRDVGVDCNFRGIGETEEELMNNLVDHAIKEHGYTREYVMKPEMQEKIKGKIKKSLILSVAGSKWIYHNITTNRI